jgi:hypothetical protein
MSDITDDPALDWIEDGDLLTPWNAPIPVGNDLAMADILEEMARYCGNGETAARMRHNARVILRRAVVPVVVAAPRMPRPRARREQRHVAEATSSSDPPLAVCPLCTGEQPYTVRCGLCGGTGRVGRETRNRWKRGER